MKTVTDTLGLARSNIAERVNGTRLRRGPQIRDGDLELVGGVDRIAGEGRCRLDRLARREDDALAAGAVREIALGAVQRELQARRDQRRN